MNTLAALVSATLLAATASHAQTAASPVGAGDATTRQPGSSPPPPSIPRTPHDAEHAPTRASSAPAGMPTRGASAAGGMALRAGTTGSPPPSIPRTPHDAEHAPTRASSAPAGMGMQPRGASQPVPSASGR